MHMYTAGDVTFLQLLFTLCSAVPEETIKLTWKLWKKNHVGLFSFIIRPITNLKLQYNHRLTKLPIIQNSVHAVLDKQNKLHWRVDAHNEASPCWEANLSISIITRSRVFTFTHVKIQHDMKLSTVSLGIINTVLYARSNWRGRNRKWHHTKNDPKPNVFLIASQ
jgi:hypothetical protein